MKCDHACLNVLENPKYKRMLKFNDWQRSYKKKSDNSICLDRIKLQESPTLYTKSTP